jgi:hypothetical protein
MTPTKCTQLNSQNTGTRKNKTTGLRKEITPLLFTYLLTYLLIPRSRVFLDKFTGFQRVKKFPAFYGTRRFFTAFTSSRHLSLSWARSIQPKPLHPTFWRFILILSSHLRLGLPSGLLPSGFPTKTLYTPLFSPTRLYTIQTQINPLSVKFWDWVCKKYKIQPHN